MLPPKHAEVLQGARVLNLQSCPQTKPSKQASLCKLHETSSNLAETSPNLAQSSIHLVETRPIWSNQDKVRYKSAEHWRRLVDLNTSVVDNGQFWSTMAHILAKSVKLWSNSARFGRTKPNKLSEQSPNWSKPVRLGRAQPNFGNGQYSLHTDQAWSSIAQPWSKSA